MPPKNPRKRAREESFEIVEPTKASSFKAKSAKKKLPKPLAQAGNSKAPAHAPAFYDGAEEDDESDLSSSSDVDFEDVPLPKRPRIVEDSDDDVEFEDVPIPQQQAPPSVPLVSGDLELNLERDNRIELANTFGRKGPSKRERQARVAIHSMHVMGLLWHNAIRNSWLCDQEVQAIMLSHLTPRLWDEIDRWRRNSGLEKPPPRSKGKGKDQASRVSRDDWSQAAKRLEEGAVDMSHGDPLFRLMQSLISWWKKRFQVTGPGIRKRGYMSLERLDRLTKARVAQNHDQKKFGERIRGLGEFRVCAQKCEGSRDVGAQLFTALLRGLGMEARMVASLQPLGFGWSKMEDADPEKFADSSNVVPGENDNDKMAAYKTRKPKSDGEGAKANPSSSRAHRKAPRHSKAEVEDSDDELVPDFAHSDFDSSDHEIPPVTPKSAPPTRKVVDDDLLFPHYWTEVQSPITNKYLPVDPIVKKVVATNRELTESLEPRGGKAEKAKQVIAYVVGFSPDGTAKDITVRYLKNQRPPGKSKGTRMPVEKIPVYNRHGRIKRYEYYNWFKTVMSGYTRGTLKHPVTEADQLEDSVDLKPNKVEQKEVKEGQETLQYYKTSQEYVLLRHLKREEALLPDAAPVRVFRIKSKGQVQEEMVYLRSDVVMVKSAETWHKQGRAPIPGEEPLKRVPYRAATLNRQIQIAEAEKATGEKVLQGLYSLDQTDWIIPPPIKDGVIPKNEYGNIDLFVSHMLPEGAAHVPYRGSVRVCKRLGIDYAESVVDFEFGSRMAVPVIQGVVIAEEHYEQVLEELRKDEAERTRKEDEKRRKAALSMWRRLLMGMRIMNQLREYGDADGTIEVFGHTQTSMNRSNTQASTNNGGGDGDDMAGGFLPEGFEEDDEDETMNHASSFFPVAEEGDEANADLIVHEGGSKRSVTRGGLNLPTLSRKEQQLVEEAAEEDRPVLVKAKPKAKPRAAKKKLGRRRQRKDTTDDDDDDDGDDYDDEDDSDYKN